MRSCELCKNPFTFDEEYCPFPEIVRRTWKYITQDKKRIVMMCLYGLYLFLFGKRFLQLIKYFKNILVSIVRRIFRIETTKAVTSTLKEAMTKPQNLSKPAAPKSILRTIPIKLGRMLKFIYSLFIGLQLLYLAYAETVRIKSIIRFLINNSKKIKIRDGQHIELPS